MRGKLLAAALTVACANAFGAVADDVKALMEQNKFTEAYQLGKQNPDQLENPLFDFYYGISALDAGVPGEGVLALERYILSFPDNRNARFNLARGYYILGEDQRARDEFEGLRAEASGEEAAAIDRYIDAIRARESRYQPTANLWIETGLGYDTNINSGINKGSAVEIPGFQPFTPVDNSNAVRESAPFYTFAAGAQGTMPIQPGVALYGSAGFDTRSYNNTNDQFSQINIGGTGGVSVLSGKNLFRTGVAVQQQFVFKQDYLLTAGLTADWAHQFNQFNRLNISGFLGTQNYQDIKVYQFKDQNKDDEKINSGSVSRSSNLSSISAGWTHVLGVSWQPVLNVTGTYAYVKNTEDRPDLTQNTFSLRAQVSMTPAPRWGVALGANGFLTNYKDDFVQNNSLTPPREDRGFGVDGVVSYRIEKNWSVRGEAQWNWQNSNIGLFDYTRGVVAAKVRYEFN
jgi:hypothetical protein